MRVKTLLNLSVLFNKKREQTFAVSFLLFSMIGLNEYMKKKHEQKTEEFSAHAFILNLYPHIDYSMNCLSDVDFTHVNFQHHGRSLILHPLGSIEL